MYDAHMSAKVRLLDKYPDTKVVPERYEIDQKSFGRQRRKILAEEAEGGAIGVIWLNPDYIVLARRTKLLPGLALIGGTVKKNEDFDAGLIREVNEESSLAVRILRLLMLEEKTFVAPDGEELRMDLAVFEAVAMPGQQIHTTPESLVEDIEIMSFRVDALPEDMILRDREKLEQALATTKIADLV
jgi:ADP-ribose pyrophosphatase YjhB (NUDIX family)